LWPILCAARYAAATMSAPAGSGHGLNGEKRRNGPSADMLRMTLNRHSLGIY
jgi:hypothetical protein